MIREFCGYIYPQTLRISSYHEWLCSTAHQRVQLIHDFKKRDADLKLLRYKMHPYEVYILHPRVDGASMETLHATLQACYKQRYRDFCAITRYPMQLAALCIVLKYIIFLSLGIHDNVYGPVLAWMVVAFVCRVSVCDSFNRHWLRGYGLPSQLHFEMWLIISSWRQHQLAWHEVPCGQGILLQGIHAIFTQIRDAFDISVVIAKDGSISIEQHCEKYRERYISEQRYYSMAVAFLYYSILAWVCIKWVDHLSAPLRALEQQWVGA